MMIIIFNTITVTMSITIIIIIIRTSGTRGDGNAKGFLELPSRGLDTEPNIEDAEDFDFLYYDYDGDDGKAINAALAWA